MSWAISLRHGQWLTRPCPKLSRTYRRTSDFLHTSRLCLRHWSHTKWLHSDASKALKPTAKRCIELLDSWWKWRTGSTKKLPIKTQKMSPFVKTHRLWRKSSVNHGSTKAKLIENLCTWEKFSQPTCQRRKLGRWLVINQLLNQRFWRTMTTRLELVRSERAKTINMEVQHKTCFWTFQMRCQHIQISRVLQFS